MASAPSDIGPVTGRVDHEGRLTQADPPLLHLQQEAGSNLGAPLAMPQIAAVARSAMKLGVPLSRAVIAASNDHDLDLWVRAEPDADGAALTINGWKARPPAPPRLTLVGNEPMSDRPEAQETAGFSTDADLRIREFDPAMAQRLGIDASQAAGEPLTRYFQLTDNGDGVMPLLTALVGRHDFSDQRAKVRGNGETELMLTGIALREADGGFGGYRIEVTMEGEGLAPLPIFDAQLDEALRTPLDRIIAAAERIVDRSEGPLRSDYAAYAGDIAAAGRHLLSVIQSMTEQEGSASQDRIDMVRMTSDALQLVQVRADERLVHVEFVMGDEPMFASGDPRGTVQILVNLIGNAIRHSPLQGTVAVIAERRDAQIAVTVADEGPGIAPDDQERIFGRYERADESTGGTGLGLAISRRLARSMGGDIQLQSAPGEGARFTLVLPAA